MIDLTNLMRNFGGYSAPAATGATGGKTSVSRDPYEMPGASQQIIGGNTADPTASVTAQNPWSGVTSYAPQYGQQTGAFNNYPSQWQNANDTYGGFTSGAYNTNIPGQWNTATDWATNYLQNGQATSAAPAYQAAKAATMNDITNTANQMAEQYGAMGLRGSSVVPTQIANYASQAMGNLGAQYAQQEMGAQEQLTQNKLAALSQLYGLGGGTAGLTQQNAANALQAAGGLQSLGGQYANLPMQAAQTASGIGNSLYGQYSGIPQAQYQNWLQQQSYANPWLSYASNFTQGSNMVPQQYSQGAGSQLLDMLSNLGPLAFLL